MSCYKPTGLKADKANFVKCASGTRRVKGAVRGQTEKRIILENMELNSLVDRHRPPMEPIVKVRDKYYQMSVV